MSIATNTSSLAPGIQGAARYPWAKQDNGKYTIFGVPIFRTFKDEDRGEIDEEGLRHVINKFYEERENGFYPRLHIGHHENETRANQRGAGYVDNFHFESGVIYADFVEVDEGTFFDIRDLRYPGRSVELNEEEGLIQSIALLETRTPFFRFPVMALEDGPLSVEEYELAQKLTSAQFMEERALMFFNRKTKKFEDGYPGADDKRKAPEIDKDKPEGDYAGDHYAEGDAGMQDMMKSMLAKLNEICERMDSYMPHPESKPSSVAMQQQNKPNPSDGEDKFLLLFEQQSKLMQSIESRISSFEKEKKNDEFADRLRRICAERDRLNFDAIRPRLDKFDTERGKCQFLDFLESTVPAYSEDQHPATKFAQSVELKDKEEVVGKYQKEHPAIREVARKASQDYRDTLSQPNERMAKIFQQTWPDEERFVGYVVEMEKESPGHYRKMRGE